ncbi:malonyl-CoA decarboxylase [Ruficoccus sp. ZRK36]|uniref:malonyl-CoA decarboxylase domain-containing protein n=1 Tax=Ruficoccus sp. ZRK36 TaxID=2866311 RepID=UPI001C73072E|nr:malonyl-CoA decarboxylase [Ruficoccus sp. ZRK36]QYY35814.1 malonyl-CoA decarboxylase [Ruficoccus sp. ZRK36]
MNIATEVIQRGKRNWSRLPKVLGLTRKGKEMTPEGALVQADAKTLREQIEACIAQRGGPVSSSQQAARLAEDYSQWDEAGKRRFLALLLDDFDFNEAQVQEALQAAGNVTGEELRNACQALRKALVPARAELLRRWTLLPAGVKFLVDMRRDVFALMREEPRFKPLSTDLKEMLSSLFNVGILQLQSISWNSPAALLEKLIAYEAVHEIESWEDLKHRLNVDRRCFAFFHPNMPNEPLIFIEVALHKGVADNVQKLLDTSAPALKPSDADTAVFYSISNTQKGLGGIPFGGFLIKQVVDRLRHDVPNIRKFITLSPIPGFRKWMEGEGGLEMLKGLDPKKLAAAAPGLSAPENFAEYLAGLDWEHPESMSEDFKMLLKGLCVRYLGEAKRGNNPTALDPVAHFHLNNGARIEQINWVANVTPRGLRESFGLMVNYRYKLERIEKHHEDYLHRGVVYTSSAVKALRTKSPAAKTRS